MKKILLITLNLLLLAGLLIGCKDEEFVEDYKNPAKVNAVRIGQIYTGALQSITDYVIPSYTRYFVIEQPWIAPFTQSVGQIRETGRYKVGAGATNDRWSPYYNFLGQFREFQSIYYSLSPEEQQDNRIYYISATIFMYDQTEKMIDLWGDIPWSEAGYVSRYGNDYLKALAKFDSAPEIYN